MLSPALLFLYLYMKGKFIQSPLEKPLQVFLEAHLTPGRLLDDAILYAGAADIIVSTFSTSEEFLLKLWKMREQGEVRSAKIYLDHKAAEKTARILPLVRNCFNEIFYCKNHSKVMIVRGEVMTLVILTSQNQTRGDRLESYVIMADEALAVQLEESLSALKTYTPNGF